MRQYLVLPSRYGVRDVTSAGKPLGDHVREIVSFGGQFAEQAKRGEWVRVARLNEFSGRMGGRLFG